MPVNAFGNTGGASNFGEGTQDEMRNSADLSITVWREIVNGIPIAMWDYVNGWHRRGSTTTVQPESSGADYVAAYNTAKS